MASGVRYQPSLFGGSDLGFDPSFSSLQRIELGATAWIDLVPGWVTGSDRLFEQVLGARGWAQRERWMVDRHVLEPRLTARWTLDSGEPLEPAILDSVRLALGEGEARRRADQRRVPPWRRAARIFSEA